MLPLANILPFKCSRVVVKLRRYFDNGRYCISRLYIGKDEKYYCDAIEDTVRDLNHNGLFDNGEEKIYGETAIPCGRYYVTFRKTGLPIGRNAKYGCIPYIHDVPNFTHIRIHNGESEKNSEGCIILGRRNGQGKVTDSETVCLQFFAKLRYKPFWLEIYDEFRAD